MTAAFLLSTSLDQGTYLMHWAAAPEDRTAVAAAAAERAARAADTGWGPPQRGDLHDWDGGIHGYGMFEHVASVEQDGRTYRFRLFEIARWASRSVRPWTVPTWRPISAGGRAPGVGESGCEGIAARPREKPTLIFTDSTVEPELYFVAQVAQWRRPVRRRRAP